MVRWRPLVAVVLISLAACASGSSPDVTTPSEATASTDQTRSRRGEGFTTRDVVGSIDVWTSIGQSRHLEGSRRITVPVRFLGTDAPVTVTSIAVRSPRFAALAPEAKESLLHPGRTVDLQVDLGTAACDGTSRPAPTVELEVTVAGAAPERVVLPIPDWLLVELQDRECSLADLARRVAIDFGEIAVRDGRTLRTELVLTRLDTAERITLERVTGSVILTLTPDRPAEPVAELAPGEDLAVVPVSVSAARCDAHGLAGSQKTFVFPVWVSVGGRPSVHVELRPPQALETAMRGTIEACIDEGT